jgi:hypothetical protein
MRRICMTRLFHQWLQQTSKVFKDQKQKDTSAIYMITTDYKYKTWKDIEKCP